MEKELLWDCGSPLVHCPNSLSVDMMPRLHLDHLDEMVNKESQWSIQSSSRWVSWKKLLFFWILSKLPSPLPPTWTTCTTFFRRRHSRFESQFRNKNTVYTI